MCTSPMHFTCPNNMINLLNSACKAARYLGYFVPVWERALRLQAQTGQMNRERGGTAGKTGFSN